MSQISKVCGIEIKGKIFQELTQLQLLEDSKTALIYGENGSGKTTISRAFLQASGKNQGLEKAKFLDKDGIEIDLGDENSNVHVFNEDYINSNIRVKEEGLNSIVILGEKKQIDDELNEAKKKKAFLEEKTQKQQKNLEEINDPENTNSPSYYSNQIEKTLKGDYNWAGRGREIKGQKNNLSVTKKKWEKIGELSPSESVDRLKKVLHDGLDKLRNIDNIEKNTDINLVKKISINNKTKQEVDKVCKLLETKIEEPILNKNQEEMELAFKSTVKREEQDLHKTINYFKEKDKHYCPFCLQHVSNDYIDNLVKNIEIFLNDKVKQHEKDLLDSKIVQLKENFSYYNNIDQLATKNCELSLSSLNNEIKNINNYINEKIRRPFTPLKLDVGPFNTAFNDYKEKTSKMNKHIDELKEQVAKTKELRANLSIINDEIAHFDIKDLFEEYNKKLTEKKKLENENAEDRKKLDKINQTINELISKKKDIVIAVSEINNALQYIFFSKDRLKIKAQDDNYVLYSRGKSVLPRNVSVGERNAIALCYFFTNLLKDKYKNNAYNDPYLIVLDDPISSFDMENKVGVISYLRSELQKFLQNKDTKIVILTHDLQVFFDFYKMFGDFLPNTRKKNILKHHLKNNKLEKTENINEYSLMLNDMYSYANGEKVNETTIGNEMRRTLEAFSTFLYRTGIASISTNKEVLECLSQEERKYFENRMYRLVLHGESHYEEKMRTIDDLNFFRFISPSEKRETAQDIVCFIYSLNKAHLRAHLCHNSNNRWEEVQRVIKKWRIERGFKENV